MKTANSLALLLLLLASTVRADEWEKLTEDKGNFTVKVPGKPKKLTQTVDTEVGKIEAIYYLVELKEGQVVYAVAFNDYPKEFATKSDDEKQGILDGVRDGNIKPHKGKVTTETKIKLDGHPGREYTFTGKLGGEGEPITGNVRLYLVGERLYQLIILAGDKTPAEKEDIGRFFFSFDRTKK